MSLFYLFFKNKQVNGIELIISTYNLISEGKKSFITELEKFLEDDFNLFLVESHKLDILNQLIFLKQKREIFLENIISLKKLINFELKLGIELEELADNIFQDFFSPLIIKIFSSIFKEKTVELTNEISENLIAINKKLSRKWGDRIDQFFIDLQKLDVHHENYFQVINSFYFSIKQYRPYLRDENNIKFYYKQYIDLNILKSEIEKNLLMDFQFIKKIVGVFYFFPVELTDFFNDLYNRVIENLTGSKTEKLEIIEKILFSHQEFICGENQEHVKNIFYLNLNLNLKNYLDNFFNREINLMLFKKYLSENYVKKILLIDFIESHYANIDFFKKHMQIFNAYKNIFIEFYRIKNEIKNQSCKNHLIFYAYNFFKEEYFSLESIQYVNSTEDLPYEYNSGIINCSNNFSMKKFTNKNKSYFLCKNLSTMQIKLNYAKIKMTFLQFDCLQKLLDNEINAEIKFYLNELFEKNIMRIINNKILFNKKIKGEFDISFIGKYKINISNEICVNKQHFYEVSLIARQLKKLKRLKKDLINDAVKVELLNKKIVRETEEYIEYLP